MPQVSAASLLFELSISRHLSSSKLLPFALESLTDPSRNLQRRDSIHILMLMDQLGSFAEVEHFWDPKEAERALSLHFGPQKDEKRTWEAHPLDNEVLREA